jgi:hypothetical protein
MLITFLKAVWRSKKAVEIKFFLTTFLLDDGRIQIRFVQIMTDPDQGGPKPYESCGSRSGSTTLVLTGLLPGRFTV